MAEINYFATEADSEALWDFIFVELHMKVFPDPWFGDLPAPVLTTRAQVTSFLNQYPHIAPGLGYFLTSADWSAEPLVYRLCENNPNFAPHWYIKQRYGGPSIHFVSPFDYTKEVKSFQIGAGSFSDYSYYYSAADPGQIIKRPDGMARTMNSIKRRLLSNGTTVRAVEGKRAIVMASAMESHENGAMLRVGSLVFSRIQSGRRSKRPI